MTKLVVQRLSLQILTRNSRIKKSVQDILEFSKIYQKVDAKGFTVYVSKTLKKL